MTITVYSKPSCVQCSATYRGLEKLGMSKTDYEVVNIEDDPTARDFVMKLGHLQAPVVLVHEGPWATFEATPDNRDAHWSGFRPDKLRELPALLSASA